MEAGYKMCSLKWVLNLENNAPFSVLLKQSVTFSNHQQYINNVLGQHVVSHFSLQVLVPWCLNDVLCFK